MTVGIGRDGFPSIAAAKLHEVQTALGALLKEARAELDSRRADMEAEAAKYVDNEAYRNILVNEYNDRTESLAWIIRDTERLTVERMRSIDAESFIFHRKKSIVDAMRGRRTR